MGLNLLVIRSADSERAAAFYRYLGLEFVKHDHGSGPEHYSATSGPVTFEIYPKRNEFDGTSGTRIGFSVSSVDDVLAKLLDAGGRLVSAAKESAWGRRAVIDDPDGHRIELTEERSAS